ncbi:hypothetical protein IT418_03605 [bacterium]|nr:hypothetical protein [bacterium]
MAESKGKIVTQNTLQEVLAQEKAKIPSKFDFNKTLFSWEANDRPQYFLSGTQKLGFTSLVILLGLYFLWVGQPLLTFVAASVFFILFVIVSVPPMRVKHHIEKVGIRSSEVLYEWENMRRFWMAEKDGHIVLYIETRLRFPPRYIFMIESFEEALEISKYLIEKMEYRYLTSSQSSLDRTLEGTYIDPVIFFGEEKLVEKEEQK